jgi:hypothetical protein
MNVFKKILLYKYNNILLLKSINKNIINLKNMTIIRNLFNI